MLGMVQTRLRTLSIIMSRNLQASWPKSSRDGILVIPLGSRQNLRMVSFPSLSTSGIDIEYNDVTGSSTQEPSEGSSELEATELK